MSENKKAKQSAYEQQESRLSAQSVAFIKLLTQRGILGDTLLVFGLYHHGLQRR